MYLRKVLANFAIILSLCALIGLVGADSAQGAEKMYDITACVSAKLTPMVVSKKFNLFSFFGRGICMARGGSKAFSNYTIEVHGLLLLRGKKRNVLAYMKYLGPKGDFVVFRYTFNPGDKLATTKLLMGTGKWKGVAGGGKVKRLTRGRPVAKGTFQFCNRHWGKFSLPE